MLYFKESQFLGKTLLTICFIAWFSSRKNLLARALELGMRTMENLSLRDISSSEAPVGGGQQPEVLLVSFFWYGISASRAKSRASGIPTLSACHAQSRVSIPWEGPEWKRKSPLLDCTHGELSLRNKSLGTGWEMLTFCPSWEKSPLTGYCGEREPLELSLCLAELSEGRKAVDLVQIPQILAFLTKFSRIIWYLIFALTTISKTLNHFLKWFLSILLGMGQWISSCSHARILISLSPLFLSNLEDAVKELLDWGNKILFGSNLVSYLTEYKS